MKNIFHHVLLVIIFNYPIYSNVPVLKSFYEPAFPNIILCGPEASPEYGVLEVNITKGYFGYDCLSTAIQERPKFEGYLYVNDDMIVNYWNLVGRDINRIWEGAREPITVGAYGPPNKWYWWHSRWGIERCNEAFKEISASILEKSESSVRLKNALDILKLNGEGKYFCSRGRSDIFYLPRKFQEMFTQLSTVFRKHNVFHEIALPTIATMLALSSRFERIHGIYLPGMLGRHDNKYLWTYYNTSLCFIHPIKFNYSGRDTDLNKALFKNWLLPYSKSIVLCRP